MVASGVVTLASAAMLVVTATAGARAEVLDTTTAGASYTPGAAAAPDEFSEDPPFVPRAGQGVGVGVGAWARQEGVDVWIPRPIEAHPGTRLTVFWGPGSVPAVVHVVAEDEYDKDHFLLHVPARVVRETGDSPDLALRYEVLRVGQTSATSSDAVHLRVKTVGPGGPDWNPLTPYNDSLTRPEPPEHVIHYGVDAEQAARGVPVRIAAYPNMTAGDTITLAWGSQRLEHVVGADEVGWGVTVVVSDETIRRAGDDLGLGLAYEVTDVVGNRSGWSETVRLRVSLQLGTRGYLAAPVVPAEVTGVPLTGVPVSIPIHELSGIVPGDVVHLWWGSAKVIHTVSIREVGLERITVNVGLVSILAAGNGDLKVSYGIRDHTGAGASDSPEAVVHVSLLST